jgi:hypothetical protein
MEYKTPKEVINIVNEISIEREIRNRIFKRKDADFINSFECTIGDKIYIVHYRKMKDRIDVLYTEAMLEYKKFEIEL